MLHIMATAIAALSPDLAPYDGEPVEHFVLDMFHIAADPCRRDDHRRSDDHSWLVSPWLAPSILPSQSGHVVGSPPFISRYSSRSSS